MSFFLFKMVNNVKDKICKHVKWTLNKKLIIKVKELMSIFMSREN